MKKRLFMGTLVSILGIDHVKNFISSLGIEGKWVETENLHFTYRFIGDFEESKIGQLVTFLNQKLKGIQPPKVTYKGLGVFPNRDKPRVLWIGVESEGLQTVKKSIDQALMPFGFPPEEKFTPHVTLLRIKKMKHRTKFNSYLFKMKKHVFLERTEYSVVLIESKLTEKGPIYSVVEEFRLD